MEKALFLFQTIITFAGKNISNMRKLTNDEVAKLTQQGCTAENWQQVKVVEDFTTEGIADAHFSGEVQLGRFSRKFEFPGGVTRRAGIRHARIHNCIIGDDVLVEHVRGYVENYELEEGCVIEDIHMLATEGQSAFGNGVRISVLNETGGREVPIFNELSAHTAYMMALYRYEEEFVKRLEKMVTAYAKEVSSQRGRVGHGARISNAGMLRNVAIGDYAVIEGATHLENGTVLSTEADPAYVGHGVTAKDFIACENSRITDGTHLERCFVGQGSEVGCMFSAHDSLIFNNCRLENGEACAVMAGPYTVSMHRSTLLIGGLFSFLNAGSGSNQSNHLYRLGAVHHGILERGCKLGSDSYIKWPAHVGAFSVVTGRHTGHPDSSKLPFSYLIGEEGATWVVPGICLRKAGTRRDVTKWRDRERQPLIGQLDYVHHDMLTPYTAKRIAAGRELLKKLLKKAQPGEEVFEYEGLHIRHEAAEKGIVYYTTAMRFFAGEAMRQWLADKSFHSEEEMKKMLLPIYADEEDEWIDLAGIVVPRNEVRRFTESVAAGHTDSFEKMNEQYYRWQNMYVSMMWSQAWRMIQQEFGFTGESVKAKDLVQVVDEWWAAREQMEKWVKEDAHWEFSTAMQTCFGIDGTQEERKADFKAVRGDVKQEPFLKRWQEEHQVMANERDRLQQRLEKIM